MSKTIAEMFGMQNPRPTPIGIKWMAEHPIPESWKNDFKQQLIGIEVEVENYQLRGAVSLHRVWTMKDDGSLRNGGVEFVTAPVVAEHAPYILQHLLTEVLSTDCCFSPRTSVHVHFNMIDKTIGQIKNLLLMYAMLEPLFYKFTGKGRYKNIFCVPITETSLLYLSAHRDISLIINAWSKYTGLNLVPLSSYGTIEARHMHGTFDVEKLALWIRLWCSLIKWVSSIPEEELLDRISKFGPKTNWKELLQEIFGIDNECLNYGGFSEIQKSVSTTRTAFLNEQLHLQILKNRNVDAAPYFKFKLSKGL